MIKIYYPRGYLREIPPGSIDAHDAEIKPSHRVDVMHSGGDTEITDLYKKYHLSETRVIDWDDVVRLIIAVKKLFNSNSFHNFVVTQSTNKRIRDYSWDFLNDTIRYLSTGHRELSINYVSELIEVDPEYKPIVGGREVDTSMCNKHIGEIISIWLSKSDGFFDLLNTMNVLFGSSE